MLADQPRISRRSLVLCQSQSSPINAADVRRYVSLVNGRRSINPCAIITVQPAMDDQHNRQAQIEFFVDLRVVGCNANK